MEKPFRLMVLLTILISCCAPVLTGKENHRTHWSVDLTRYGYPVGRHGAATVPYSDTAVAASSGNVALALNIEQDGGTTADALLKSTWQLTLLVFDANDGKLRAKCGPWSGSIAFDLWSTGDGNFLLYREPSRDSPEEKSDQILLLSPSCQPLRSLQISLLPNPSRGAWFFLSPSRRSFLIEKPTDRGTEYELRDANTLTARSKWVSTDPNDPHVISVSDDGTLGVRPTNPKSPSHSPAALFYRNFNEQQWHRIPNPGTLQPATFLSNQAFLEFATIENPAPCATSNVQIAVQTMDRTANFSTVVSQRSQNIGVVSPFAASPSGNYFGTVLRFTNEAWLWCQLDMGPEHYKAYVWSSQSAAPVARVSVAYGLSFRPTLAFAPDGSWFAMADNGTVRVRPLKSPRTAEP